MSFDVIYVLVESLKNLSLEEGTLGGGSGSWDGRSVLRGYMVGGGGVVFGGEVLI